MGSNAALAQLLDMGIPRGRAAAALKRSKGDAMAAAERVFAGEFDDIASDEEVEPEETNGGPSKPRAIEEDEDLGGDSDIFDEDDAIPEDRLLSDPYAGIFFSKDRSETVIEIVDLPVHVSLKVPGRATSKAGNREVRLLSMGEWMSGCPEGNEQSFLFQLWNFLAEGSMPCSHGCGHAFARKQEDFFALIPDFPAYIAYLASIIRPSCPKCSRVTCLACGERVDSQRSDLDDVSGRRGSGGKVQIAELEVDSLLHCVNLQGVIIGVGLFNIEQAFAQGRKALPRVAQSPPKKKARTSRFRSPEDSDVDSDESEGGMYGSGRSRGARVAKGTGYAGAAAEDRSGQKAAEQAQLIADTETAALLSQVQIYLPTTNRASGTRTSDHLVHPTALAHLRRRSGFVNDLLRNDSLLDMSNRGGLYRALFDWLEVVSSHESLSSMLAMPQMRPASIKAVAGQPNQRSVLYEGSASPRELLENIVIQAQAALRGLEGTTKPLEEEQEMDEDALRQSAHDAKKMAKVAAERKKKDPNVMLHDFCDRIIGAAGNVDKSLVETKGRPFVERMKESLPRLPDGDLKAEEVKSGVSDEAIIKIYEDWAGKARFQYADLTVHDSSNAKGNEGESSRKAYRHAYSSQVVGLEGHNAPKRSLAIAKELAILTTNLPVAWHSSIFLRVDEARVDCIKALIVGPEGTPYENGVFLFDIFLPLEYNTGCPMVKSMTTNGGKYRYNPNLYADGKVCLSLLGTWSGPGWIAGQSTLLQVLISIQSLILCEEPYCNEPGWASDSGSAASKAYSANIRRMVVVDAMANNIKNPPYPFENEIKTHFRLKARYIQAQLDRWEKMDDGKSADGHNMGGMGAVLDQYGANVDPGRKKVETPFQRAAEELRGLLDGLDGADAEKNGAGKRGKAGKGRS